MAETRRLTWEEQVEQVVKAGYSREFAEAFVPMPLAEARRRALAVQPYQSPMTGLVLRNERKRR